MSPKRTKFNLKWLDVLVYPEFSGWLDFVKGDNSKGRCTVCQKSFELGNMGIKAVKSHSSGASHAKFINLRSSGNAITNFLTPKSSSQNVNSGTPKNSGEQEMSQNRPAHTDSQVAQVGASLSQINESGRQKPQGLGAFFQSDDVLKAEVLWAMNIVHKHMSLRSTTDTCNLMKLMFHDSAIAQKMLLGRDKASYIINYGLSHYFSEALSKTLKTCYAFTICFDESLNKVAQKGQMDLLVRYWDVNENVVCTRYLNSVFLSRASAENILEKFLEGLGSIHVKNILHVSMDGPNVNLSFLTKLQEHMNIFDPDGNQLIKFGTCGLHVVHGAVKSGLQCAEWDVASFLRNLYYLFKDSPARRAQFTVITGCSMFPKKFCNIRWLENSECLDRAITILDQVKQYLTMTKLKESKVSQFLTRALKDPFLKCKLLFFRSLSLQCETFLCKFQSTKPLVPFLYEELTQLLTSIMKRFVKGDKLTSQNLLSLNLDSNENLVELRKVDVGFGTRKCLTGLTASEKEKLAFHLECQKILKTVTKKLIKKCPLQYKLVVSASSLSPAIIVNQPHVATSRFIKLLEVFHYANRITETVAENAKLQYEIFCGEATKSYKESFTEFLSGSGDDIGLDKFFSDLLAPNEKFKELWFVVKLCLILSHGNGTVESGFSINKSLLIENLREASLISQRMVHNAITAAGGVEKVVINKAMLLAVRGARQRYREDLERKQKLREEEKLENQEKRKIEAEIKELEKKRKLIQSERNKEDALLNETVHKLQEKKKKLQ